MLIITIAIIIAAYFHNNNNAPITKQKENTGANKSTQYTQGSISVGKGKLAKTPNEDLDSRKKSIDQALPTKHEFQQQLGADSR